MAMSKVNPPLALFFILICLCVPSNACPSDCYCVHPMVDCYDRSLSEIPDDITTTAFHVNLKNNRIKTIKPERLSRLTDVESLLISNNQITSLQTGSLVNMTSLKQLYLTDNIISDIEPDAFQGLSQLQVLDMRSNQLEDVDGLLNQLVTLERLDLGSNKLTAISDTTFSGLNALTYLSLSWNRITSVSKSAFANMTQLSYLILSGNPLQNVDGIWEGVTTLSSLDLSSCQLTTIPSGLPSHLNLLKFANNSLAIVSVNDLSRMRYLGAIYLDNNRIRSIEDGAFGHMPYLSLINLSSNKLTKLPSPIPANVTSFIADGNNIQRVFPNDFDHDSKMTLLSLKNNSIQALAANTFTRAANLGSLYLDGNKIKIMYQMTYSRLRQLRVLSLDSNPIQEVKKRALGGLPRLARLCLSGITANITGITGAMFRDTPSLMNLNLQGSPHLTVSIINDAQILRELRSIKYLNLMDNNLTKLDADIQAWLPKLRSIRLAENPWRCDPELVPLRKWIERFPFKFRPTNIICQYPDALKGTPVIEVEMSQFTATTPATTISTTTLPLISTSVIKNDQKSTLALPVVNFPPRRRQQRTTVEKRTGSTVAPGMKSARTSFTIALLTKRINTNKTPRNRKSSIQTTTFTHKEDGEIKWPKTSTPVVKTPRRQPVKTTRAQRNETSTSMSSQEYKKITKQYNKPRKTTTESTMKIMTALSSAKVIPIHNAASSTNKKPTVPISGRHLSTTQPEKSTSTIGQQTTKPIVNNQSGGSTYTDRSSSFTSPSIQGGNKIIKNATSVISSNKSNSKQPMATAKSGESRLSATSSSSLFMNDKTKAIVIGVSTSCLCLIIGLLVTVLIIRYRKRHKQLPVDNSDHHENLSDTVFIINHIHGSDTQSETLSCADKDKTSKARQNNGDHKCHDSKKLDGDNVSKNGSSKRKSSNVIGVNCFSSQSFNDSEMLIFSGDEHNY